ncbi:hypothetical protein MYU51_001929 [Penicillium brevicompactum]
MSNKACYVVSVSSEITPPASDKHANRRLEQQNQQVDLQKRTQVKQGTDLQYRPDRIGNEVAASHLDETQMQTLKDGFRALNGVTNGHKDLLVIDGHDQVHTKSNDQVHDNVASTMMQTSHAHGLVGASNDLITSQVHRNLDYPKTLPGIQFDDNNTSTMVATLHHQAYALIEVPVETMKNDPNADSHELAHEVPEVRGAIQKKYPSGDYSELARDIGWHKVKLEIPDPLIGGYTNGELFAFIRRFNKAYFAAWRFDRLMPLVLGILIMVVSSVPVRTILFPSAPRALVNIRTGGIQKPQVGLLGTNDTLTGAPEKQPHEAIEEEAANLVENVRHNIQRAVAWLKGNVPKYEELAQPKNNFLRGVPTTSQIAITLRIGEAHKTPLPPVTTSNPNDPDHQNPIEAENIPLGTTSSDVLDATMPSIVEKAHGDDDEEKPNHNHLSKIVRFFKGNAKSVVEPKLAIDHVWVATGSQKAKGHLSVLPKTKTTYTNVDLRGNMAGQSLQSLLDQACHSRAMTQG